MVLVYNLRSTHWRHLATVYKAKFDNVKLFAIYLINLDTNQSRI